jgi:hypothetical protein
MPGSLEAIFMSRIGLLVLSVFSVFAAGILAASTASATFTNTKVACGTEGIPTVCMEAKGETGLLEASGSEEFTGKLVAGSESLLEIPGFIVEEKEKVPFHIVCKKVVNLGTIEQPEPLVKSPLIKKLVIEFTECTVLTLPNCLVTEPIKVTGAEGKFDNIDPAGLVLFTPEKEPFTTWEYKSKGKGETEKCPATLTSMKSEVTGAVLCTMLEAETDKAIHTLECKHEAANKEDELLFAKKSATFEIKEEIKLVSELPFDLVLS